MQRCFFLLFSLAFSANTLAQFTDVRHTELSFYATDTFPDEVRARAVLELQLPANAREARFQFQPDSLYSIRVKQGRLKDFIPFKREGEEVVLNLASWSNRPERFAVAFEYTINLKDSEKQAYIRNSVGVLSFNGFNAYNGTGVAASGLFFPSVNGDVSTYSVNLSVPSAYEVFTIGEAEFKVSDHGITHHFWNCRQALPASAFYLITGDLVEDELDDLDEVYHFSDTDLSEIRALNLRSENLDLLSLLEEKAGFTVSDSMLLVIDSLSTQSDLSLQVYRARQSKPMNAMESQLLLHAAEGNRLKGAYLAYLYQASLEEPAWRFLTMKQHSEEHAKDTLASPEPIYIQSAEWLQNYYPDYRQQMLANGPDWNYPDSSAYLVFADSLRNYPVLPRLSISYRYREGMQNITVIQDTAYRAALSIPLDIAVYLRDTVIRQTRITEAEPESVIRIEANASPQAVQVNPGRYFPAYVEDNRPDVYNLYQLSNAQSEEGRIDALSRLLQTSNANLFSTALGIAMDDPRREIRAMALERAGDLNVPAQQKLKDTLLEMAQRDPDTDVRQKAKELVSKYYSQK